MFAQKERDRNRERYGGATMAMSLTAEPNQRPTTSIKSISGRDVQAIFFRRLHQPRRPPLVFGLASRKITWQIKHMGMC
jgi:hypothetical protein